MTTWSSVGATRQFRDKARFYTVNGVDYPSVTTILDVLDKPGLMYWAANMERRAMETSLLDVLGQDGARDPEWVLGEMAKRLDGAKAFLRDQEKALSIGTAAHAWIEWRTRQMLGEKIGPEPTIPDAAAWAVEAWKDWAKAVEFRPFAVEQTVYHAEHGYAGTYDWIAHVRGVMTLGDIKTSKAIYPESFLQNIAYRAAAHRAGLPTEQGVILRLPKVTTDPAFEAMVVPDIPLEDFLACKRLWEWKRRMEGKRIGQGQHV